MYDGGETDLKVFPELPLRGEYRLVGAVVQEHERHERDQDLKAIASNNGMGREHYGAIHATFDKKQFAHGWWSPVRRS